MVLKLAKFVDLTLGDMRKISLCPKTGLKRGAWTPEEDGLLAAYISRYGHWNWRELPKYAGLSRCGKSCRLRWMNYLRPNIKRGHYSKDEDKLIISMHEKLGNRWSAIAACLPGRTDNEIKNHWHTHLRKCTKQGTKANGVQQKLQRCKIVMEPVQDCSETVALATTIPENSIVTPISPHNINFNDKSLSHADSDTVIHENLLKDESTESQDSVLNFAESFLSDGLYQPEYPSAFFSPTPGAEFFHTCDMFDGYNIDIFCSNAWL